MTSRIINHVLLAELQLCRLHIKREKSYVSVTEATEAHFYPRNIGSFCRNMGSFLQKHVVWLIRSFYELFLRPPCNRADFLHFPKKKFKNIPIETLHFKMSLCGFCTIPHISIYLLLRLCE